MADLITAITEFFKTLYDSYLKSPIAFIVVLVAIFGLYQVLVNNALIKDSNASVSVEQERFKKVIQLNEEVPALLENWRTKAGAQRVLVRQFHNGKYGISGIPFTFVQTTYAVAEPGFGLTDQEAWLSYPISSMSFTLSNIFNKGGAPKYKCFGMNTSEVPDDFYKAYLNRYKTKSFVTCPLVDSKDSVVGFITAGYLEENDKTHDTKLQNELNDVGRKIVIKLDDISSKEHKWWKFWE